MMNPNQIVADAKQIGSGDTPSTDHSRTITSQTENGTIRSQERENISSTRIIPSSSIARTMGYGSPLLQIARSNIYIDDAKKDRLKIEIAARG